MNIFYLLNALKVSHWVKNFLVFVPVLLVGAQTQQVLLHILITFGALCLIASAGYIANDLIDLEKDKKHPVKSSRAIASGKVSIKQAFIFFFVLTTFALFSSYLLLNHKAFFLILFYLLLSLTYSTFLKKIPVIDVWVLALLHTLRIYVGGAAIGLEISIWLACYSMFFFYSLASVKRVSEVKKYDDKLAVIRGTYESHDLIFILNSCISASFASQIFFSLYVASERSSMHFTSSQFLVPLIFIQSYWMLRIILLAQRCQLDDDPIKFALKDTVSWICFLVSIFFFVLSKGFTF